MSTDTPQPPAKQEVIYRRYVQPENRATIKAALEGRNPNITIVFPLDDNRPRKRPITDEQAEAIAWNWIRRFIKERRSSLSPKHPIWRQAIDDLIPVIKETAGLSRDRGFRIISEAYVRKPPAP